MARERPRAAVRKAAARAQTDMADAVAIGVRQVAKAIGAATNPNGLWLAAPLQYVAEQAAVKLCEREQMPGLEEDVALYLVTALTEFVVALAADFDRNHFDKWIIAQRSAESV